MSLPEPKCFSRKCRHYRGVLWLGDEESTEVNVCAAFPEGIPDEIAYGENPHTKPFQGDNGIQFEKKKIK